MRYLVTPAFGEKVTAAGGDVLSAAQKAMAFIEGNTRDELLEFANVLTDSDPRIFVLRSKNDRIFITFASDKEGEYALILDIVVHGSKGGLRALSTSDPQRNMMIDPRRNMMIDPTRNMMIDPNRNMLIDPRRNMMIDPTRNMMIDPKRNMMIDLRRNMMIDPVRNYSVDPKRNWSINPRQNSAWDGPLLYDLQGIVSGFVVRANEQVSLLFDNDGNLLGPLIQAGEKAFNVFSRDGDWEGFMIHNGAEGYNWFDLQGRWNGFLVGELQQVEA